MNDRAQNVVEYILLVAAVVTVFLVFLNPAGVFRSAIENQMFNGIKGQVDNLKNEIKF